MTILLSPSPIALNRGVAIVRIVFGLLLIYHGHEVFRPALMKGYTEWETFKNSLGSIMPYVGKSAELVAGICLLLGLFTRPACIVVVATFGYITFFIGHGHFWYEDQHPFMFLLIGVLFFFTGPGAWSVDERLFNAK
jgi:putative oxidoreductase